MKYRLVFCLICLGDVLRVDEWTGGCAFPATHRLSMKRRRADSGDHAEDAASSSSSGGDFVRGRKPKRAHGGEGEARWLEVPRSLAQGHCGSWNLLWTWRPPRGASGRRSSHRVSDEKS